MKNAFPLCILVAFAAVFLSTVLAEKSAEAESGFESLFDGKSLSGWEGDTSLWRAEDGMIVGETSADAPVEYNQFLTWTDGELDDFELKVEFKIESGNSGVQVRSFRKPSPYSIGGYQADIDADGNWTGSVYGESFRGVLAKRGQKTTINEDGKPEVTGEAGDFGELGALVKKGEWNEYQIVAQGNKLTLSVNGTLMSELIDEDTDVRRRQGLLALQLHKGDPMKVMFRNIRLKRLPLTDVKKVVFVAGKPSHGPRQHEHNAGCLLLAGKINKEFGDKLLTAVYTNGWPSDPTAFQNADSVVMFADGGQRHPAFFHLKALAELRERSIGIGAIHYAVEMVPGETNDALAASIGGAFEVNYSVNPHWDAKFDTFPDHPVANGVSPFEINDEWYFNMRFRENMEGVTPILSSVPPAETMSRPDGHHSGNPEVRKMVEDGLPQHVSWVYERPDGGRGFGFTGAHFHDNWENDSFRKVVLNAIAWISHVPVPEDGMVTTTPTKEELDANLDPKPEKKPQTPAKTKKAG